MDTLKTILLDFQEAPLRTGVPRRLEIKTVPGKATVCIGVRRSGKSTFLCQIIARLMAEGVPREDILYLNFFDDRLHGLRSRDLASVIEAYYSLYPHKKGATKVYCFFDEIQVVPGWEPFVERLLRTERCEVYLTGSSAHMLSREVATQMRGRALSWEIFPFSFREFLDWKGMEVAGHLSTKRRLLVQNAFDEFRRTGGFPEVLGLDPDMRVRVHQEYFHSILGRDVIERHDVSHPKAVTDLAHWLVDNTASLYSLNRVTGYLKSLGHKAPKTSVAEYLGWFEDAYFLFAVRLYDAFLARSHANPKKVYCVDHAVVSSVSSGILVNSGHLFENLVFMALRRVYPEVFYYRTRSGREVDFCIPARRGSPILIQACESVADPATQKREVSALLEAMRELGVDHATIVTGHGDERITADDRIIQITPAWRFVLDVEGPSRTT